MWNARLRTQYMTTGVASERCLSDIEEKIEGLVVW